MTPFKRKKENTSFLLNEGEPADDRAIALAALAEWFTRRYPDRPAPRRFSEAAIALVVRCGSAVDGDAAAKLQAQRDAIEGAFRVSEGPPAIRFIWGDGDHFVAHRKRGRELRMAAEVAAALPDPRKPKAPRTGAAWRRRASATPSPEELDQIRKVDMTKVATDLDAVLGDGWRHQRR